MASSALTMMLTSVVMVNPISQVFPMILPIVFQHIDIARPLHVAVMVVTAVVYANRKLVMEAWCKWWNKKSEPRKSEPEMFACTVSARVNGDMEVTADKHYPAVVTYIRHLLESRDAEGTTPYHYTIVVSMNTYEVCHIQFHTPKNTWKINDTITVAFVQNSKGNNMGASSDAYTEDDAPQYQRFSLATSRVAYSIRVESAESMATVRSFIDDAHKYYDESLNYRNGLFIFVPRFANNYSGLSLRSTPFLTTKSFDNLFFADKERLLQRLDMFMNNKDIYESVGMPHTLGLLLHGPPGTGKTSCIKAIARYMKRHLVVVPCSRIDTFADLMNTFYNDTLDTNGAPMDKRIFVFEEIDCGHWANIVRRRDHGATTPTPTCEGGSIVLNGSGTAPSKPTLTLGQLLEALDGVIEMSGRMVIFTTNRPQVLDPALLRPGRIDLNLHFGFLNRQDVDSYYSVWFGESLPKDVYEQVCEGVFSQAQLGALFATQDMEHIHAVLTGDGARA